MRILMIGALTMQYIRDNWVLPLKELYDVDFVDISPLLSCYKSTFYEHYLYSIIRSAAYDYLFFYADSINSDFNEDFFATVAHAQIPIVTFYADDEPEVWYQQNLPYDHRFSLVATHSLRGLQRRKELGTAHQFMYLPWGFNPAIFKRTGCQEKVYDIVYFGLCSVQRENPSLYLRDSDLRQRLLVGLYEFCQENDLKLAVFGGGWDRHPVLYQCAEGVVSTEEMVRIYNQAKVVFNPGFSADNNMNGYQTKLRHFEVAGCGCLQITNYNPELAELFVENQSIVFFKDEMELKKKLLYYLRHASKRQQIAEAAYLTAHKSHTMKQRISTLFNQAQTLYPLKQEKVDKFSKPAIKTLRFDTAQEARQYLKQYAEMSNQVEKVDFLHLIAGEIISQQEYSICNLPQFSGDLPMIGVRTYLQVATLHHDSIQRRRQNMAGMMVNERIRKCDCHEWIADFMRANLVVIENDEYLLPLCNYLIPTQKMALVAQLFLNNDYDAFNQLPLYNSGLVINDLAVVQGNCPDEFCIPPYLLKLRQFLNNIQGLSEHILLYGGRGAMADDVLAVLKEYPQLDIMGVVDRGLAEAGREKLSGYPVYSYDDIQQLKPTIIIIAADISGKAIYEKIKHLAHSVNIITLYDMEHPSWSVNLPL